MGDTKNSDKDGGSSTPRPLNPKQQSRRDFLEGAGATAVVTTAVPVLGIAAAKAQQADKWGSGATPPTPPPDSFPRCVIEIVVKKHARSRFTTIQNWSVNVYNLVTQRAIVHENAKHEWVDANLGSQLTMKYPSCYLVGEGAYGGILSMAFAGKGQHQDTGGKVIHVAPRTTSRITSKSISKDGGRASYRGLLKIHKNAVGSRSNVVCDALLLDDESRSDTYPSIEIDESDVSVGHEASVSKIGEEQLFYLKSRGLSEEEAITMVVSGFIEPLVRELPMEYAVEMNRLIQLQMEGSIG